MKINTTLVSFKLRRRTLIFKGFAVGMLCFFPKKKYSDPHFFLDFGHADEKKNLNPDFPNFF